MLWLQESVQVLHRIKLRLIKKHSRMEIGLIFPFLCLFQRSWFSIFPRCDFYHFFDFIFVCLFSIVVVYILSSHIASELLHKHFLIAGGVNLAFLVSLWHFSKLWFENHTILRTKQNSVLFCFETLKWKIEEITFKDFSKES